MRQTLARETLRVAGRYLGRNGTTGGAVTLPRAPRSRTCTSSASNQSVANAIPEKPAASVAASHAVDPDTVSPSSTAPGSTATTNSNTTTSDATPILDENARPAAEATSASAVLASDSAASELAEAVESSTSATGGDGAVSTVVSADGDPGISSLSEQEQFTAQMRELLKRNAVRSALFHFIAELEKPDSPAVTPEAMRVILPVLGRYGWAPSASDTISLALKREYNLDVGLYNCALHAMSRSGDFDTISGVIDKMWSLPNESRPNATSYNYLIGSYMYRGAVDKAFDVLIDMKNHMIYPTFATYHALITGCLRSHDPRRAYQTLQAVERQRFDVGAMTISQVIVSCADADLAQEVLDLMPKLEASLPRYAQEVHRIAERRATYRMTTPERTTSEERAVIRGTPRLELGAFTAMMHCAFRNGRADIAMATWSLLRKYYPNVQISSDLWYCLIGAFGAAKDYDRAFDALGCMRESGIEPKLKDLDAAITKHLAVDVHNIDAQYYRLADRAKRVQAGGSVASVNGAVGEAPIEGAAEGVNKEEEKVLAVDSESVVSGETDGDLDNLVTDASPETAGTTSEEEQGVDEALTMDTSESLRDVLAASDVSEAGEMLNWEEMRPTSVGIVDLNCIIAACSQAGDLDRAFQTYDEAETTFGLERDVDTLNALLEGCINVKHVRGGMRILAEMENLGLQVTGSTVHLAARLLTRAGRTDELLTLVRKVQGEGGRVPLQTYLLMIRFFARGESFEKATETLRLGEEGGYTPKGLLGRLDRENAMKIKEFLGMEVGGEARVEEGHRPGEVAGAQILDNAGKDVEGIEDLQQESGVGDRLNVGEVNVESAAIRKA